MQLDYLIVGQGLAGSWLSYFLLQMGQKVQVIDRFNPNSASNVASGIINPITGRKLLKTWKIDTLLPFAQQVYTDLEKELGKRFCYQRNLIWQINDVLTLNNFEARQGSFGYEPYIKTLVKKSFHPSLKQHIAYAEIQQCLQIDTPTFIAAYRKYIDNKNLLIDDWLDVEKLKLSDSGVEYKGLKAKKVIFCEGYQAMRNPYFSYLSFVPAKGEVLIIKAKDLMVTDNIIKGKVFLLPLGSQQFWVGSTYVWKPIDEQPTEAGKQNLLQRLRETIAVDFEVLSHQAGVRPTTRQRRPFIGLHPQHPQLGIFNGLGTKGVSLSPYFAKQFAEHLVDGKELEEEVNIAFN